MIEIGDIAVGASDLEAERGEGEQIFRPRSKMAKAENKALKLMLTSHQVTFLSQREMVLFRTQIQH